MPSNPIRIEDLLSISDPVRLVGTIPYWMIDWGATPPAGQGLWWRDELQSLLSTRLTSPASDMVLNDTELSITAKISARYPTDFVGMNIQLNHDWAPGTALHLHIHWWQTTTNTPNWLIGYRWQKQLQTKTTGWTLEKWYAHTTTWNSGTLNQITSFPNIIPPSEYGVVSDILQIKLYRDYTNVSTKFTGTDPVNVSQDIINLDAHIQIDGLGSPLEYSK